MAVFTQEIRAQKEWGQGAAVMNLCTLSSTKATRQPKVQRSTGHPKRFSTL